MNDEQNKDKPMMFVCPNCGEISQDDVVFLCNICNQEELILQNGVYMCPACLIPGENFQCMLCDSKEVKIKKPLTKATKDSHRNIS